MFKRLLSLVLVVGVGAALLTLGLLGHGAYQLLFIYGIAKTRAGTASLVIASSPAIIALVMRVFRVKLSDIAK